MSSKLVTLKQYKKRFIVVVKRSYMAFLVIGIMAPEITSLEKDVHEVEKEIRDLKKGPDGQLP